MVECCWIQRGDFAGAPSPAVRVLPDGCMDILFTLGAFSHPFGGEVHPHRAFVVGTMSRSQLFDFQGWVEHVAIRFRPGGARPFLQVPAVELLDTGAPLEALWGFAGADLPGRLDDIGGDEARARFLFRELETRRAKANPPDALVLRASELIHRSRAGMTVETLSRELRVSARTLERRFRREVGLSPKRVAGIARFRTAVTKLEENPWAPVGRVAMACGYYDQAHFTREFRALAGVTPGEWRGMAAAASP